MLSSKACFSKRYRSLNSFLCMYFSLCCLEIDHSSFYVLLTYWSKIKIISDWSLSCFHSDLIFFFWLVDSLIEICRFKNLLQVHAMKSWWQLLHASFQQLRMAPVNIDFRLARIWEWNVYTSALCCGLRPTVWKWCKAAYISNQFINTREWKCFTPHTDILQKYLAWSSYFGFRCWVLSWDVIFCFKIKRRKDVMYNSALNTINNYLNYVPLNLCGIFIFSLLKHNNQHSYLLPVQQTWFLDIDMELISLHWCMELLDV